MTPRSPDAVPDWQLYGENTPFPDIMHLERIVDRAAGLDWRISPHRHARLAQVFLLERGVTAFTVDGCTAQPRLPCLLFLPPGIVHGFTFAAGTEGWVLTLPVEAHPEVFGEGGELAPLVQRHFTAAPSPDAAASFQALAKEWREAGPLRRVRLRAAVARLVCDLVEPRADERQNDDRTDARLARFMALVAAHHVQQWPIARYAAELGLSVRSLARICREAAGRAPHQLVERHAMREACRLLAYTRMTVQQVAFQLGYQDPSYFNRRFRQATGVSPGSYRRRLEE